MKSLKEIFSQYKFEHKALPAFNIDTFEIYQAVEMAVSETMLPCLVQLSAGEDKFIQAERLLILVKKAQVDGLPIYLNMDHCQDPERLYQLAHLGFDMLHFDGSAIPYPENLTTTKDLVSRIKNLSADILIEAEFNKINLVETGISSDSFTDPKLALEFITATGADLLAVSIGNLHGVNFTNPEHLDLELLKQIITVLPSSFFTLHGGSGISADQVSTAINLGIIKININTDLRLKFKQALGLSLASQNTEKNYLYFEPVIEAVAQVIKQKLIQFSRP